MVMDREGFEAFVGEVVDPLRRFLLRRADEATAEDVLAETLLVCWRRRAAIPTDGAVPWAFGVARLCLRNAERSVRRQQRLAARVASVDPPRAVEPPEVADEALAAALAALRPAEAELIRLWAWEELTPAEIGAVLGISANAASIRLHRVRKRLAELLRKSGADAGHVVSKGGDR